MNNGIRIGIRIRIKSKIKRGGEMGKGGA